MLFEVFELHSNIINGCHAIGPKYNPCHCIAVGLLKIHTPRNYHEIFIAYHFGSRCDGVAIRFGHNKPISIFVSISL